MEKKVYPLRLDLNILVTSLESWFSGQEFEVQSLLEGSKRIIQAKKGGTFSNIVGMSQALTVIMSTDKKGTLEVEVGQAKWIDKVAAGAISWFLFAPLAITAGLGFYNQKQLINRVWQFIDGLFIEQAGKSEVIAATTSLCPKCKHGLTNLKAKFCPNCGQGLTVGGV